MLDGTFLFSPITPKMNDMMPKADTIKDICLTVATIMPDFKIQITNG